MIKNNIVFFPFWSKRWVWEATKIHRVACGHGRGGSENRNCTSIWVFFAAFLSCGLVIPVWWSFGQNCGTTFPSFFWHIPLFECVVANMIGVFLCYFILLLWIELFKMCFLILIFLQEQTHTPYCYLDLHSSRSLKNHHQGELNQIFFLFISSNSFFVSPPTSVMVSSWT